MRLIAAMTLVMAPSIASAGVIAVELTPTDVGSANPAWFSSRPTVNPSLFFGAHGINSGFRVVDFNTAPAGTLAEGGSVTNQYASLGVTMNDIRISEFIYGGNNYGAGFAAEDDVPQVYTFSTPVSAVGIVNTSPDNDLVEFFSGPDGTGTLLFSFRDQEGLPRNFNIDRFVGGVADSGTFIHSFRVSNTSGNLELDELVFVPAEVAAVPEPSTLLLLLVAGGVVIGMSQWRRRFAKPSHENAI